MKINISFENAIKILGGLILLMGFLSIMGWLSGILLLASYGKLHIPMAPDTAIIFTFLGLVLFTNSYTSSKPMLRITTIAILIFFSLYGLLKVVGFLTNVDLTFENYLSPATEKWGLFPLKRMSPITGFLFLVAGVSLLIKTKYRELTKTNNLISILGLFIAFMGFTVLLSHLFQIPLLYESKIIPIALTTAICFLFLGITIMLLGGKRNLIVRYFTNQTPSNILIKSIIPILFIVILFQGFILNIFNDSKTINFAMFSATLSLFFIIGTSFILIQVSKSVFKNAILAENKIKQAEIKVQSKDELIKLTGESVKVGGWEFDVQTNQISLSREVALIMDYSSEQTLNSKTFENSFINDSKNTYEKALALAVTKGISLDIEIDILTSTGKQRCLKVIGVPVFEESKVEKIRGIIHDITEEKDYDKKQLFISNILSLLNRPIEWELLMEDFLFSIKEFLRVDAIAIQSQDGKNALYNHSIGFSNKYNTSENTLCANKDNCDIQVKTNCNVSFECFYGLVIKEKTDSNKPYFTPLNSFWFNSIKLLNQYVPESNLPNYFRNQCNVNGYESVALIPLHSDDEIIGYLQLSDRRTNFFDTEIISFLEELTLLIGIAYKRIQSDYRVKENEKKFKLIFESAAVGVALIDSNSCIPLEINQKYCSILGYTIEEMQNIDLLKITHKDDIEESINHRNLIISGELSEYSIIKRYYHKNGNIVWVSLFVSQMSMSNHLNNYHIAIVEDISKKKETENQIQKRDKEIQCLQNITRISDKDSLTLGKYLNKVVNLIPSGFQFPENTQCRIVLKDHTFQSSSFEESNLRLSSDIVTKSKRIGFIEVYHHLKTDDSTVIPFLAEEKELLTTITKNLSSFIEKKRKEQIQKIIYNSAIAVDSSESLTDLIDYIKKQIGSIIDTSNFFAVFYDEETDSISLPYHHDQRDIITKFPAGKTLTKHVIKTQKSLLANRKQIEELHKAGIVELIGNKAAVWLGVPLIVKGKVTGIFAVQSYDDEKAFDMDDLEMFEFISRQVSLLIERKKVEMDLMTAFEKAKESDRLKSTFLATMSHELRTPLNAVIGFSDMLQGEMDIAKVPEYAGIINNCGLNLLEIIEDIFDITLLESGEVRISNSEFNIKPLIDEIKVAILSEKEKLGKQTLDFRFALPTEFDDFIINTDRSKLKQILVNLLKNAFKFTFEGYVEFGFSIVTIEGKENLKFFIKDTGIGIREEYTQIIFQTFRQVDDTNTRLFGGTGVGLSVAKKYSDMINGKIWVESIYGEGSTFFLTMPYTEVKPAKTEVNLSITPKFPDKTILIAEDEVSNYELLLIYLEDLEVNTLWAHNGEEAVSMCQANKNIDLVLMDIKMPKMSGLDATSIIRRTHSNLPIIAQTAFVLHGDEEKAFEVGCNDYIGKPIKRKDLYVLLSKYL